MVEHFHSLLKETLRCHNCGADWAAHLPWVLMGLRAAPKEDSGLSSAERWCTGRPSACQASLPLHFSGRGRGGHTTGGAVSTADPPLQGGHSTVQSAGPAGGGDSRVCSQQDQAVAVFTAIQWAICGTVAWS
jgi:hypothetical protein